MVASVRSPQVWSWLAVTVVNDPSDVSVSQLLFMVTQQVMVASVRRPQEWLLPAVTAVKVPSGTSYSP